MSKVQVEANEAKYFRQYVSEIMDKHEQTLSFFELNLEVQFPKTLYLKYHKNLSNENSSFAGFDSKFLVNKCKVLFYRHGANYGEW